MPARTDLTPEEALRRVLRRREIVRESTRRWRERRKGPVNLTGEPHPEPVRFTASPEKTSGEPHPMAPPQTPPMGEWEVTIFSLSTIFAAFADRGYVHKPEYLTQLHRECPLVDLVTAAYEMADWLDREEHRERRCNSAFIGGWVRREQVRALRALAEPHPPPAETRAPPPRRPVRVSGPQAVQAVFAREGIYLDPSGRPPDVGLGSQQAEYGVPRLVRHG